MSLIRCHKCDKEISSYSRQCPQCGAKKPLSIGTKVVFFISFLGFVLFVIIPFIQGLETSLQGNVTVQPTLHGDAQDQGESLSASSSGASPFVYEHIQESINTFCQEEWTKRDILDRNMFAYCQQQENEGYQNILSLRKKNQNFSWMNDLEKGAVNQWTKRGIPQYSMIAYTIKK